MQRIPKTSWGMARRIEEDYARQLIKLTKLITQRLADANDPDEIRHRLRVISNDQPFMAYCEALAENMARQIHRSVNTQWRKAALQAAHKRGRVIFEELEMDLLFTPLGHTINDIIYENATLIKTIPDKLGKELASIMSKESAFRGVRSASLTKEIEAQFTHLLPYQAKRIARTETSKAQMALTRARAQGLGLNWYIWRTAQDGDRVRPSHRHMEGVLVNWDNPPCPEKLIGEEKQPPPYNAGNIYNCRCFAEPVIHIDWVDFPCKIHLNGSIRQINHAEFAQLAS